MDRSFRWLGRFPLGVDLADTVRVVGSVEVDLLADDEALATWVDIEQSRFPVVQAARGNLSDVHALRAAVREMLFATAEGTALPEPAREAVNQASARCPTVTTVLADGSTSLEAVGGDALDRFYAAVARSVIDVVTGPERERLAVCRGPSCGMFFLRADSRQRWCSPECGNRARVARHAARRRSIEAVRSRRR
jgi:predicted RNA-binding Zn ribbon-like protein